MGETVLDEIRTKFMESFGALRIEEHDDDDTYIFIFPKPDDHSPYGPRLLVRRVKNAGYGVHYVGRSWYLGSDSEYGIIVRFGEK